MKHLFFFLFLFLLLPLTSALAITENPYTYSDYVAQEEAIYFEVMPEHDQQVLFTLKGSNGYAPVLELYDEENTLLDTATAARGKTAELLLISANEKTTLQTYTVKVVLTKGLEGAEYTFGYTSASQNDAGSTQDAPESFKDALLIQEGSYEGFLGGPDAQDMYLISLEKDETITLTLEAEETGSLGIVLTDSSYFKKIDVRSYLDVTSDETLLTASYTSLQEQEAFLSIEGDVAYLLAIESDKVEEPVIEIIEQEPLPPLEEEEEVVAPIIEEEQEGKNILWLLLCIVALVGIGVLNMVLHKKKHAPKEEETIPVTKKAKKKTTKKK